MRCTTSDDAAAVRSAPGSVWVASDAWSATAAMGGPSFTESGAAYYLRELRLLRVAAAVEVFGVAAAWDTRRFCDGCSDEPTIGGSFHPRA